MINDYKFEMKDYILRAVASDETLTRLAATTAEFSRQIIEREDQIILNNLPDIALQKLKKQIDSILDTRGLNEPARAGE